MGSDVHLYRLVYAALLDTLVLCVAQCLAVLSFCTLIEVLFMAVPFAKSLFKRVSDLQVESLLIILLRKCFRSLLNQCSASPCRGGSCAQT